ncbi:GDNF family receptor alpha-2-like [Procambarus clarkii]|uniref:GDNF family receptor alpha-2-like n=1 Tax=Procambarus clarkii TaxID=6728 RepID=UPI003742086E
MEEEQRRVGGAALQLSRVVQQFILVSISLVSRDALKVGSGHEQQQEHQTLNCLLAKQLCDEDTNCSAILKVLPTLCGPELVACSTVTVSRCQAALRTLVQFPWFQPTCLCREPRLDPQCNAFRDLVFDHPCVFVTRKEVDMHPLSYIPTCEEASDICRSNPWCKQRLDMFRATCKFREGQCRNPDREDCLKAWLQLRETPLLGCICPDGLDKKCSRLYSLVNENPCVGKIITRDLLIDNTEIIGKFNGNRRLDMIEALYIKQSQPAINFTTKAEYPAHCSCYPKSIGSKKDLLAQAYMYEWMNVYSISFAYLRMNMTPAEDVYKYL